MGLSSPRTQESVLEPELVGPGRKVMWAGRLRFTKIEPLERSMRSLPPKARVYILVLLAVTLLLAVVSASSLRLTSGLALNMALFAVAICIADLYPIVLPFQGNAEITVSCAAKAAAAIIFGPRVAILVTLLGTLFAEGMLRRAWYKAAFNASEMTVTFAGISVLYELLCDGARNPFHSLQNAGALGCMMVAYFLINTGLVTTIVSLATGAKFAHIWKHNFRHLSWNDLTVIPLGAVMASLWEYRPWSVLALVLPLVVVRQSFRFVADLQRQTREALISMADAIDQRDPSTYQHSRRVAVIAEQIANEMELPVEDVETIRMAARLHDVGKIGMGNDLLFKPTSLDDRERVEFRRHPLIGADLVGSFRLFNEGHDLILYHHERYDGEGYPQGIAGEDIPLGSRILAVADSLDAMTSKRPYRPPFSLAQAMEEMERNRDKQFDPVVVDALARVLEQPNGQLPWLTDGVTPE